MSQHYSTRAETKCNEIMKQKTVTLIYTKGLQHWFIMQANWDFKN